MGIIKKLDPELVKRIAAGEVIERPSSIVKELVENSIDAGASRVTVFLSNGGLTSIKVSDNGIGIASDDLPLLMERHVTSKIHDFEDLECVGTLGFRGEALYSVASVSKFTLRTRSRGEDAGGELSFTDGEKKISAIAHPVGTSIEAESIFYNTPARRKFLKSSSTEYARCAEVVTRFALAYPHIAFELHHDGRLNLQTTGGGVQDSLLSVFGKSDAKHFIPVTFRDQQVGVRGQISDPGLTRTTRKDQTFTINGRIVYDIALNLALERAYSKLIAEGKKPLCVIDLSIDPWSIDVNVHPHKREVRLAAPRAAYDAIQRACEEALRREISGFPVEEEARRMPDGETILPAAPVPGAAYQGAENDEHTSFVPFPGKRKDPRSLEDILSEVEKQPRGVETRGGELLAAINEGAGGQAGADLPKVREGDIIQYLDTYVIMRRGDLIYLIDQHNLHETLLYREMKGFGGKRVVSQKLLFPITVEFTPEISAVISGKSGFFSSLGFELEEFGNSTFLIRSLPHFLPPDDPKSQILELFDEAGSLMQKDFEENFIITAACKGAVKANTRLSAGEMIGLAAPLLGGRGFNCPHGRPAVVVLDRDWFAKTFGRPTG